MREQRRKKEKKAKASIRGGILKIVFGALLLALASAAVAASALLRFDRWHGFDEKKILECDRSVLLYASDGSLICAAGRTKRVPIEADSLPEYVKDAFIAAEDLRFYSHDGIDLYRVFGAAWADIKAGGYVQGASTISQQLIKLSHLSSEKTLDRKLEEAVLALRLEAGYSKDEILEMYLNYVYFGGGYYGIEAASLGYFGVHAAELTPAQAAQLAGVLKSPSAYAPHIDPEASLTRRNTVLGLMRGNGFLSESEYSDAIDEKCELSPAFPAAQSVFADYAIDEACGLLGMDKAELCASGIRIRTTLDPKADSACAAAMEDDSAFPSDNAQGALVVLRSDGGIAAMCGGRGEYSPSSLNRAVDIERQPGSLIKPILVYAPAIQQYGYTAATLLTDEPTDFSGYSPRNSDQQYYGTVTLRQADAKSRNAPAVSVLADIGLPNAVMFAERMGISFEGEEKVLALALGGFTHGVSPLEMAGAYSVIANGGVRFAPTAIERIEDAGGNLLYDRSLHGERVLSRESAYILTSVLQSAAKEGTARRLGETGLQLAAKTGTAIDGGGVRDAWCAAFSPDYTAVIWMGTDSAFDGSLPEGTTGGGAPAMLLGRIFKAMYENETAPEFVMPEGITECDIDLYEAEKGRIGKAPDREPAEYVQKEWFLAGTEPTEESSVWTMPEPPEELGWSIDRLGRPVISFVAASYDLVYEIERKDPNGLVENLAEFGGDIGYLSFTDETAERGAAYVYTITAINPNIKEDGQPKRSRPSRELHIVVP